MMEINQFFIELVYTIHILDARIQARTHKLQEVHMKRALYTITKIKYF